MRAQKSQQTIAISVLYDRPDWPPWLAWVHGNIFQIPSRPGTGGFRGISVFAFRVSGKPYKRDLIVFTLRSGVINALQMKQS